MALPLGRTGTSDSLTVEYFTWEATSGRFLVHMHRDAVDGLARDVIERSAGLPVEVGGLLLGHAGRGERPVVWIERYQRIECQHRSGPHFILDPEEYSALEAAASEVSGDLNVIGFYRSHLRPGFQLEASDFELTDRYFRDAEDLFLLIRPLEMPEHPAELLAQFFVHDRQRGGELKAADPAFPFRGRLIAVEETEDNQERTARSAVPELPQALLEAPPAPVARPSRRLVPDFLPAAESPRSPREFFPEELPALPRLSTEELNPSQGFLRKRWPLLAAVLLVGGGIGVFVQQSARQNPTTPVTAPETSPVRPLGLSVDPSGQTWRITWNASATEGARAVQLFVKDGDEPSRIDLKPRDLASGSYRYPAKGTDVTFRLEVTGAGGRIAAESFRVQKTVEKALAPVAPPEPSGVKSAHPTPINRVPPVVPASIRPRIKGTIPVDVRVRIDEKGRVLSATPISKPHSGVESFLMERAVAAARQWRYQPDAPGTEIIHFTFKK